MWKGLPFVFLIAVYANCFGQEIGSNPYHAGFKTEILVDSSRIYKPNTDKKDSLHFRPVELDIWYPSSENSGENLLFGDLFGLFEQRANKYQDEDFTGITEELVQYYAVGFGLEKEAGIRLLNIQTDSYENVNPVKGDFPLIIYMAGYNGMGFENYKILEKLAENGFIVVSIWSVGRYPGNMTNDKLDTMEQVYDAEFAIKFLKNIPQFNIDFDNIGILGLSWGGMSAAILLNRNPSIKAMVSLDGTETFYFGETQEDDDYLNGIYEADILYPEKITSAYYYMESGNKWDEFSPTDEYHYFKKINTQKNYLRFLTSEHEDFGCFPSILKASDQSIKIHGQIIESTTLFFDEYLKKKPGFYPYYDRLIKNEDITNIPFKINPEISSSLILTGKVKDATTDQILPYVNIGILNKEKGSVSNKNGIFELKFSEDNIKDTVRISMIGYKPKTYLVKNLLSQKDDIQIKLEEDISELEEVIIGAEGLKHKVIGNKTETKFINAGFSYDYLGAEMGIRINIKKSPTFVDTFNFSVSQNRLSAKVKFRLNIYNIEKGKPGKNILKDNIIIPVESKQTGVISVDLKKYNIILKDDVIVTLEWVETEGENIKGEAIFFSLGVLTYGTYHKESSQGKMKKLKGMGVGYNFNVRY